MAGKRVCGGRICQTVVGDAGELESPEQPICRDEAGGYAHVVISGSTAVGVVVDMTSPGAVIPTETVGTEWLRTRRQLTRTVQ